MKRPAVTTILTYLVYVALAAVVVFAFFVQQDRINRADTDYATLFTAYQEVTQDCADAAGCYTDAPTPSEVIEGAPGAQGEAGSVGPAGRAPTAAEIAAEVRSYCASRNDCRGSNGRDGRDGQNGADSQVPGPQGPPGNDSTVPGPQGNPGADGRSIQSVECLEDGTWLITYSDTTTQTTDGPCRVILTP